MDKPLAVKVRNLITYIGNARGFQLSAAPDCPYRNHIGALLTDVVLQAGLNYQHVVAPRVCKVLNDYPVAYTVNRFSAVLQKHSIETVLDWHDCEKQIRMIRILEFCKAQGIQDSYQLKLYLVNSKLNSAKFKSIKGIGDKTYDYLLKLLGVESVAVDRHVYKFVSDAGIIYKNYKEAKQIVEYAADMMQISRRALDYSIWLYMSNKKRAVQFELFFDFLFFCSNCSSLNNAASYCSLGTDTSPYSNEIYSSGVKPAISATLTNAKSKFILLLISC